jgi:hypothetical protein
MRARERTASGSTQLPVQSESLAARAHGERAARKRCGGRECLRVCSCEKLRAPGDVEASASR